jgi:hypothetical protein
MKKKLIVLHIYHQQGTNMLSFDNDAELLNWQAMEAKEN